MKLKNYILGAILGIIGLLMIIIPETCIKFVVILVGIAATANGIYSIAKYYNLNSSPIYKRTLLLKSITSIIIGIIAVLCPIILMNSISAIWTIITFILAVYSVLYALTGFFIVSFVSNLNNESRKRIATESFIYFLIAILLFIIPIGAIVQTLFRIAGIVALVLAVILIAREVVTAKKNTATE